MNTTPKGIGRAGAQACCALSGIRSESGRSKSAPLLGVRCESGRGEPARRPRFLLAIFLSLAAVSILSAQSSLVFNPAGTPKNKHVVLLSGDEEYRSEEALPMLAKILSQRHGFKATVLFALDPDGTINPDNQTSLPDAEALDSADLIIMALRFRQWPDAAMKKFVDAYLRGVPIIALRTSTHAFNFPAGSAWDKYTWNNRNAPWPGGFGKAVLGETWVTHWGRHKVEATRAVIEPAARNDPLLRGVADVFGTTDVYEAYPPADARILMRGQVLNGMTPADGPANYTKKRAGNQGEQGVNDPMMPISWVRVHRNEAGTTNRILTTTMGAATDLENAGLRRFVVNGVYWGLGLEVPADADVSYVDPFTPRAYGFKGYRLRLRPANYALGQIVPEGDTPPAAPAAPASARPSAAAPFTFSPGEHVAFIGNALGDRMQHHGWLEAMMHTRFPTHQLLVRNLAVSGDEVVTRARSQNFGTPDEWLTRVGAGTIFAFFGFNESFQGPAGLAKFKEELASFLTETRARNYNRLGAPRIVLFSPIANENHPDPNFAVPPENNANLKLYADAMAEVARDRSGVTFVDLFSTSQQLYAEAARAGRPLTHNGIHLTEAGEARLAERIFPALFGEDAPAPSPGLRAAINEKNAMWHSRYRTVDGYNVYGGRSALEFSAGPDQPRITNFQVMQEEMTQRDVLTANRDRRVWSLAQGVDAPVDDSNLPPVTAVPTNKPGTKPDGSHEFLGGEEAIAKMTVHPGLKVNLFADEKQFPQLAKPVQMAWDTRGRLWVAVWPSYPERTPDSKTGDSLLVLEDTNGDGRADQCTPFIENLNCPTGFQFYQDGVLVVQAPDLWFVRDTDGDGRADWKERVLMGLDSADSHHTSNSLALDPGGAVYLSDGTFHRTQVETARGPVRNLNGAIYRFEPQTGRFETYVAYDFANPHGRTFDRWGNDLIVDGTANRTYFGAAFSGRLDYPARHAPLKEFWPRPSRPSATSLIITSRHFPDEFQGNYLNSNVIGFQGFYRVKVVDDGSGLKGERLPDLLSSSDPNFRPVAAGIGPDGALYFLDWSNAIIGHMQHHIRDPNRDHVHGRIYRVSHESRPLTPQPKIHGQPVPALLELLKAPENHVRELAKIELGRHDSGAVIAALRTWRSGLNPADADYQHQLMEALWVHQWHNVIDVPLLERMLRSPSPDARAAATRVLCYWSDRVPHALALLKVQAADEHPRVRLHAVRAASFFRTEAAVDVALTAIDHPLDYYLEYTLGETIKQLKPYWRDTLGDAERVSSGNPARIPFLLKTATTAELQKMARTPEVLTQLVQRTGVADADRRAALTELARLQRVTPASLLLTLLEKSIDLDGPAMGRLLVAQPPADLAAVHDRLSRKVTEDNTMRPYYWAALAVADGTFEAVWARAEKSAVELSDLLTGITLVPDAALRATAYPRIVPYLQPTDLQAQIPTEHPGPLQRAAIRAAVSTRQETATQFRTLAHLIQRGEVVPWAAHGLRGLPRESWADEETAPTVAALVDWAKKTPASARREADYLNAIQTAEELLGRVSGSEADKLRAELGTLRVTVFLIRTMPEQMRYDTTRIVVKAGQAFQIILENPDVMPHNLVVTKPGTRDEVANAAMLLSPEAKDRQGRAFVPDSTAIVAASKLLDQGQSEILRFNASLAEGTYEFVCTFPGHAMLMRGELVVTSDPEGFLKANPVAKPPAPAAHAH